MRSGIKRLLETVILRGGPARLARARLHGRALILAYHNILPEGARPGGDGSLHLPRRSFGAQLDQLARSSDVVPLESLLDDRPSGSRRPRVAITFDDAYQGAVTVGIEELVRRGLPGTIFVAPAFLGGRTFWWDVLSDGVSGLTVKLRTQALTELRGQDDAIRRWAHGRSTVSLGESDAKTATEAELAAAARQSGVTVGSHTWSHPNLALLNADDLRTELYQPLAWLQSRFESAIPWLSYPYGLSADHVERAAASCGYRAAVRISGGWIAPNLANRYALPRLNVPAGLTPTGFGLRTAGLFCH